MLYAMLSKLTDEGAQTIKENPGRIMEVDQEVEAMGVKVLHQYALLGPYDFLTIVEAPDNLAVAKSSLELGSRGTVRIETLPAMDVNDLIQGMA